MTRPPYTQAIEECKWGQSMRKNKSVHQEQRRRQKPSKNGGAAPQNGRALQALITAKNRRLKKLIQSWLDDESGYDEETWPQLEKALKENRIHIGCVVNAVAPVLRTGAKRHSLN